MRKIWVTIMVVMALLLAYAAIPANAAAFLEPNEPRWIIVNRTPNKVGNAIPVTILRPGKDRILKWKVIPCLPTQTGSTEIWAALHDATSHATANNKRMEGELESTDDEQSEEIFLRPLYFRNGIFVYQGAFTAVLLEWEKYVN